MKKLAEFVIRYRSLGGHRILSCTDSFYGLSDEECKF